MFSKLFLSISKIAFASILFCLFVSCQNGIDAFTNTDTIDERAKFCDVKPRADIGEKYAIVVITDIHLERGNSDMEDFVSFIDSYEFGSAKKAYCIVMGDIANGGKVSEYEKYLEFRTELEAQGWQVFCTVGNHDTYASGDYGRNYMKVIDFSTFFRIKQPETSLYVVDTGDGTLGTKQFNRLEKEMKADGNKKLVFSHYAPYPDDVHYSLLNDTESAKLLSLYSKENVAFVFSGHTHIHNEKTFGKFRSVSVGSIFHDEEVRNFAILFVDEKANSFNCVSVDF